MSTVKQIVTAIYFLNLESKTSTIIEWNEDYNLNGNHLNTVTINENELISVELQERELEGDELISIKILDTRYSEAYKKLTS